MKRILSMILALVMVLTCLPALPMEAHAATVKSGKCGDDLRWTLSSEGTLTISGTGDMYDYKAEEAPWYQYGYLYSGLHTLKIMDGVTSIGDFAFYGCSKIQNVIIADSVTEIGGWAFSNCSGVTTVTIPKSVTSIGEQAFSISRNLTSIVIPDSVTNIGSSAFYECTALTNVTLPNTITNMGNSVFWGCSSLTSIDFFTNVFTTILPGTFRNCTSLKTIKIPNSITSIGYTAFDGCTGLASVTIPNSVTDIGDQAFRGCTGIKEMTIPQSVTSLGKTAFCGCTGLTSVTIPNSIKEIGCNTFYNCKGLTSVTIPDSVKTIGDNAFEHCTSLTAVEIGNSVTKIGGSVFRYCSNLKKVTIPNSVTDIGGSAFLDCSNLTSVTIPNSVTNLGWGVFRGCTRLREITFKGNAPSFGNEVFTSVTAKAYYPGINDTWTESVRQNYGGKITWIPVVSVIASGTCGPNLTWVLTEDGVLTISGTGEMTHFGSALEVPWHNYRDMINRVVIEYGATGIGPYAFSYCRNMTSVEIPNSVAFIYQNAFGDCSSLQSVNIPDSVTSIGFDAFALCTSLTSVTIPKSVTWIGNSAFHGCTSLTKIKVDSANTEYSSDDYGVLFNKNKTTLISCPGGRTGEYTVPASVKSIGKSAFAYCKGLTSVKIGDNVDSVGNSVFYECRSLSSVILGGSIPTISDSMFFYCDSLTSVEIPASVSVVGSYAFGHCYNLQRITFTGNAPSFGDHGFYGVTATAYYPANNTTWTEEVRQDYGGKITWAPTYAIIASGICGDNLTWVLTEDGTLAISGTGEMYGYNVSTGNYAPWYNYRESIKTVVIETGATSIGSYAFSYCRNITSVEIPNSVTGIGISAFYDCSSLTSVPIPDSAISIGAEAFFSCDNLASVSIGNSVESIGEYAFGCCSNLTGIWVSTGNPNFSSDQYGVLFDRYKSTLIQVPGGITGSYVIPDGVISIGDCAASFCDNLTSVSIPDTVISIGDGAFECCTGLTSVSIGNSVESIGLQAFYFCMGLTSVSIPDSVTSIGEKAFYYCPVLKEISFEGSAPAIGNDAFYKVTATAYYHPDGTWTEDVRQNYGGSITWVAYTTGPAIIASGICGDNLTWVLTEDGTLTISGTGEMYGYTNDSTGNYAPWYNYRESIKEVVIETGATSIGSCAFYNCGNMTRVEIPDSVTAMRYSAFNSCASLPGVEIPNSVSYIGDHAFKNCTSLASVEISNSVTELISGTFYGCTSLTNVVIPDSVTNIGWGTFYGCTSLTSVAIPDSVTRIAADAFYTCKALKRVEIPASVTSIYNNPFAYCTSLTEIKVDEQNPNYSSDQYGVLFDKNQTLLIACPGGKTTAYEIPDSVTSIGEAAFQGCMGLPSVHIPRSVADIGNSAFWYAIKLKEITFEGDAPCFGNNYVFSSVKATAYYPANNPSWTEDVRQNYGGTITWVPYCIGECIYTTVVTAPTCTQYGYTTYTCACGDSYVSDYTSPLGHDYKYTSTTEPTCTEDGYDLYTCSRCSANKKQILSATGHHFGDDNVCDNCGFTIPEDHQHSYTEKVVSPTCTTGGYTEHTCSCGHSYRDNYKEQTGHSWDDGVVTKEPSCTAEGTMTHTCNTCGETIIFVIEPGHDWDETVTKEATCTEDGVATRVCKLCGEEETIVIPAGHKWNEGVVTKEPTCTEKGLKTVTCTVCGTTEEQEIPELGHNFYNGVCTRCGAKIPDIITPDTEHPDYGMYFLVDDIRSNYGTELINEYGVYLDHNPDARIEKVGIYLTQEGNLWRRCIACVGEGITYATYVPYLSYGSDIKYTGLNSGDINIYRLAKNDKGIWCYNDYTTIGVNLTDWRGNLLLSLYDIGQAGAKTRIFDDLEAMKRWLAGEPEHTCSHTAVVTAPTCTADGYTTYTCSCGDTYTADPVTKLGHDMGSWVVTTDPTCTVDGQQRRDCSRCDYFETGTIKAQGHKHTAVVTAPTCTADGFTTYTCSCGDTYTANTVTMLGHDWGQWYEVTAATPYRDGQQRRDCSRCDHFETQSVSYQGNALKLPNPEFAGYNTVWIEGLPYAIQGQGDERYVVPPAQEVFYMVTYTYHAGDGQDVHTQYPTGMKVYKVSKGEITYIPELDDLLQYSGSSIRIVGKKGIRMITSLTKDNKKALTGKGLAGFKLLEYGTALCFASEIQEGDGLVLGRDFTRSNFAYKKGEADPVFASPGNLIQYTNVLVGFSLDQCKEDIAMRPYIILEDAQGNQVTLYGGTIYRSIGYIAYQNRSVFKPKTAAYNYVWELIHHVYGDKYDADFKG